MELQQLLALHARNQKCWRRASKPASGAGLPAGGCESITLPLDVAQQFITSPAVDAAIVKFEQDWQGRLDGRLSDALSPSPGGRGPG